MKGSGTLVASVLAASTVAFGSSTGDRDVAFYSSSTSNEVTPTFLFLFLKFIFSISMFTNFDYFQL